MQLKAKTGLLGAFLCLGAANLQAQATFNEADTFPIPPSNAKMLFYLQRTPNANTIIYELNYRKDGGLNEDSPVKPYWIRYTEPGRKKKELNYLQSTFAYGIKSRKIGTEKWSLKMVAYDKLPLTLKKGTDNRYHVFINLNGKETIFDKAYIKIDGGTLMSPNVPYIDLYGNNPAERTKTHQRIKPKR